LEHGDSSAVGRGRANRPDHDQQKYECIYMHAREREACEMDSDGLEKDQYVCVYI